MSVRVSHVLVPVIVAVLLLRSDADSQTVPQAADGQRATITVQGTASRMVPPDLASMTVGVEASGKTTREALDASNTAMTALLETLKRKGVDERDIQTEGLQLTPVHEEPSEGRARGGPGSTIIVIFGKEKGVRNQFAEIPLQNGLSKIGP